MAPQLPLLLVLTAASGPGKWTPGDAGMSACNPPHDHYPFCNTSLSIDDRVLDLISRIPDSAKPNLLTARGRGAGQGYEKSPREAFPEIGVPSYYWGSNCLHASMFANCTTDGRCSTGFPSVSPCQPTGVTVACSCLAAAPVCLSAGSVVRLILGNKTYTWGFGTGAELGCDVGPRDLAQDGERGGR